jgi:hypothetical protein
VSGVNRAELRPVVRSSADTGISRFVIKSHSLNAISLQEPLMFAQRIAAAVFGLAALASQAQTAAGTIQRDVNQQTRIQQGLQTGQLTTQEASRLEQQQTHIQQLQSRSLADGRLSATEQARLASAQNRASASIAAAQGNRATANPNSASSQRMQAVVSRQVNQQTRMQHGLQSGSLTAREASRLQHGQAQDTRLLARASADGQLGRAERAGLQRSVNQQGRQIYRQNHDAQSSRRG